MGWAAAAAAVAMGWAARGAVVVATRLMARACGQKASEEEAGVKVAGRNPPGKYN
jgi:hypothetical protein